MLVDVMSRTSLGKAKHELDQLITVHEAPPQSCYEETVIAALFRHDGKFRYFNQI